MRLLCTIFFLLLTTVPASAAARYAVARVPAPVYSTSDIETVSGRAVKFDGCGQPRSLEFIALPGTAFSIIAELTQKGEPVYRVLTEDYPYPAPSGYFVQAKHLILTDEKPQERQKLLPPTPEIIERLTSSVGTPYLWGSNMRGGLFQAYSGDGTPLAALPRGIDCSGLLYEATDGFTPRNTSALATYGSAVPIAGLPLEEILRKLRPLDLIVWKRHVVIVLDAERSIESQPNCKNPDKAGVVISSLPDRLKRIMKKKKAVDSGYDEGTFVVRRWMK